MNRGCLGRGVLLTSAFQLLVSLSLIGSSFAASGGAEPVANSYAVPRPLLPAILEAPPAPAPAPVVEVAAPAAPPTPAPVVTGPRRVMFIGDSMAYTSALGLAPHAPGHGFEVINEGINGCGVVRGGPYRYFGAIRTMEPRCEAWDVAWQNAVNAHRPDMVVMFIGRWELMDRMFQNRWTNLLDPGFAAYVDSEIERAITIAGSTGARVVLFSQPYYQRGLDPTGGLFPEDDPVRVDAVNMLLRNTAARRGVPVVDVGGWLSPAGRYTPDAHGMKVRSDGVHLTVQTGEILSPWLFPQLQQL